MAQESPVTPGYTGIRSSRDAASTETPGFLSGAIDPTTGNQQAANLGPTSLLATPASPLANVSAAGFNVPSSPGLAQQLATSVGGAVAGRVGSNLIDKIPNPFSSATAAPATTAAGVGTDASEGFSPGFSDLVATSPAMGATGATLTGTGLANVADTVPASAAGAAGQAAAGGAFAEGGNTAADFGADAATDAGTTAATDAGTTAATTAASDGGDSILGGIGDAVGSVVGRVICTELVRQRRMDPKLQRLDAEFTRKALTDFHVIGYWAWAIPYTRLMRRPGFVGWIATRAIEPLVRWRLQAVLHAAGERPTPHLRGSLVRLIGEPIRYQLGVAIWLRRFRRALIEAAKGHRSHG